MAFNCFYLWGIYWEILGFIKENCSSNTKRYSKEEEMKARIRKKDKDKDGNSRYILEWEEEGKVCTKVLNPNKLLDYYKESKKLRSK